MLVVKYSRVFHDDVLPNSETVQNFGKQNLKKHRQGNGGISQFFAEASTLACFKVNVQFDPTHC